MLACPTFGLEELCPGDPPSGEQPPGASWARRTNAGKWALYRPLNHPFAVLFSFCVTFERASD